MQKYRPADIIAVTPQNFEELALSVYRYQYMHTAIYRRFADLRGATPNKVNQLSDIPFLPIGAFKNHAVISEGTRAEVAFKSSGTGGTRSTHFVADTQYYEASFLRAFELFYGPIANYHVLALLPSYLEQGASSLVYMVDALIQKSGKSTSGFYLNNYAELAKTLRELDARGEKVLLVGVSYALLDLIDQSSFTLKHTIIMETGGMKGRRKEMIKEELHATLKAGFGVSNIHSEYGMTELLSQAYSHGDGVFQLPNWMRVLVRDATDPLTYVADGITGGINVIDLANIHSCAFIATQDLGKRMADGSFYVMGRFDDADIRGCNLMLA